MAQDTASPKTEKEMTITLTLDEWYALSDGMNLMAAVLPGGTAMLPNAVAFEAARKRLFGKLMGFDV